MKRKEGYWICERGSSRRMLAHVAGCAKLLQEGYTSYLYDQSFM